MPGFRRYGRRPTSNRRRTGVGRGYRRRFRRRSSAMRPARPLGSGAVMPFKQSFEQIIGLNTANPPTNWNVSGNNLYRQMLFKFADLDQAQDLSDVFAMYKLKGVRMQMYFSNSVAESMNESGGSASSPNQQIMCWMDRNTSTTSFTGTTNEMLNSQTAVKKLCLRSDGKPLDIYMPVRALNIIPQNALTNVRQPTFKSQWISTDYPSVDHFGLNMMLQRIDGSQFTSGITNSQYAKIIYTVYFQMKKVA